MKAQTKFEIGVVTVCLILATVIAWSFYEWLA
jgi:hypothetical protein